MGKGFASAQAAYVRVVDAGFWTTREADTTIATQTDTFVAFVFHVAMNAVDGFACYADHLLI